MWQLNLWSEILSSKSRKKMWWSLGQTSHSVPMRNFGFLLAEKARLPLPSPALHGLQYWTHCCKAVVCWQRKRQLEEEKKKRKKKQLALLPHIEVLCLYLHSTTTTTLDNKMNIQMIMLKVGCISYISLILCPDHYTTTLWVTCAGHCWCSVSTMSCKSCSSGSVNQSFTIVTLLSVPFHSQH